MPTITPEQISTAKAGGLTNVEALATACVKHNLPFHYGCAILQKETGGRNIYGHDKGGIFTTTDGSNIEVTEANFAEFLRLLALPRSVSNGVGPMQITYKGHFPTMKRLGLRPWVPADNIDYGIGLITKDWRAAMAAGHPEIEAFKRAATIYNLGTYDPVWPYGSDAVAKAAVWQKRLNPEGTTMYSSRYGTSYQSWRGGNFAPITIAKLTAIPSTVRVTQGGLSFAPASAMTHAGIGAFDLNTDGMSKDEVWEMCKELWEVDIIPCPRGFSADSFQGRTISNTNDGNEHLHCLDLDCRDSMHPEAQAQCREILAGGDGLLGNRAFTGPGRKYRTSWGASAYNPKNRRPVQDDGIYFTNTDNALGLNLEREPVRTRDKGFKVEAVAEVKRWGRWNVMTEGKLLYALSIVDTKKPSAEGKA